MGELESIMDRNQLNFENAVSVLENTGPGDPAITDEELGGLLRGSLSTETRFYPNQGVLDEIISSGKLSIFNINYYPKLIEEMDKILQLIDDEIE